MVESLPLLIHAVGFRKDKIPYMGQWQGRVMVQYALSYVSKGRGYFEAPPGERRPLQAHTAMFQPPEIWHCNDPDEGTVWDEYWVMFDLQEALRRFGESLVPLHPEIHPTGPNRVIVESFRELIEEWFRQEPGCEEATSLLLHKILQEIHAHRIAEQPLMKAPDMARLAAHLRQHAEAEEVDWEELARTFHMNYHTMRLKFKTYNGAAPKQYWLNHKMIRAKKLLFQQTLTIQEVAHAVGMEDAAYFSRFFKGATGVSPREFRNSFEAKRGKGFPEIS